MRGVNKVDEICDLYALGNSIPEVSEQTGIPLSTIRCWLANAGILRTRAHGIRLASEKGRLGAGLRGKKRIFTAKHCERISRSKTGVGVGVSLKPNGYIDITMGKHKGKGRHRVVMEEHLGRLLGSDECVHHINHNRSDNRISNLMLMTRKNHARLHALERRHPSSFGDPV